MRLGMAMTFRAVAKNLNVALGTVHNTLHRFEQHVRLIQNIQTEPQPESCLSMKR